MGGLLLMLVITPDTLLLLFHLFESRFDVAARLAAILRGRRLSGSLLIVN
jgi:hypothetical protein